MDSSIEKLKDLVKDEITEIKTNGTTGVNITLQKDNDKLGKVKKHANSLGFEELETKERKNKGDETYTIYYKFAQKNPGVTIVGVIVIIFLILYVINACIKIIKKF